MIFSMNGILFLFFFFNQKTAYEMRIRDCSSDVCSSDLHASSSDVPCVLLSRPAGSVKREAGGRPEEGARYGYRIREADTLDRHSLRKGAAQPRRHHRVEQDEDAGVVRAAHQPAEGLTQPQPGDPVVRSEEHTSELQ